MPHVRYKTSAHQLAKGDRVRLEDGRVVTLTSVTKGMLRGCWMMCYGKDEWGHIGHREKIRFVDGAYEEAGE